MNDRRDRIRVHIEGKEYDVVGGSFQEMLAAVKQVAGRRFVSALKVWQLPGTAEAIQNQLDISGYQLEGGSPIAQAGPPRAVPVQSSSGDRIKLRVEGYEMAVVGGEFREMLAAVKSLPGRRFDGKSKTWEIPEKVATVKQRLEAAGFRLEGAESVPAAPSPAEREPPQGLDVPPPPVQDQEPDLFEDDDSLPYEPPDWWDDDNAPPPRMEPPGWWDEEETDVPALPPEPARPAPASPKPAGRSGGDTIRIRWGDMPLVVSGGAFRQMLDVVKQIPGRRFNGQDKVWEIPASVTLESIQQQLAAAGFSVERE